MSAAKRFPALCVYEQPEINFADAASIRLDEKGRARHLFDLGLPILRDIFYQLFDNKTYVKYPSGSPDTDDEMRDEESDSDDDQFAHARGPFKVRNPGRRLMRCNRQIRRIAKPFYDNAIHLRIYGFHIPSELIIPPRIRYKIRHVYFAKPTYEPCDLSMFPNLASVTIGSLGTTFRQITLDTLGGVKALGKEDEIAKALLSELDEYGPQGEYRIMHDTMNPEVLMHCWVKPRRECGSSILTGEDKFNGLYATVDLVRMNVLQTDYPRDPIEGDVREYLKSKYPRKSISTNDIQLAQQRQLKGLL